MARTNKSTKGQSSKGGTHEAHKAAVSEQVRKLLDLETLADRKRDSLDFHDVSVASIREIIDMAFAAGVAAGKGEPAPATKVDLEAVTASVKITTKLGRFRGEVKHAAQWVNGTVAGFRFECLVFPEHAASSSFELGESRISKLWLGDRLTGREVASFDRGWDVRPTSPEAAAAVDALAGGLAETVFEK
jgi:hypothetical protein